MGQLDTPRKNLEPVNPTWIDKKKFKLERVVSFN